MPETLCNRSPNALDPNLMTAAERLTEIGEILAAGLVRLRAKEREKGDRRELSLDFTGSRSVHAKKRRHRENAWKTAC
jgi:hypothetical protein